MSVERERLRQSHLFLHCFSIWYRNFAQRSLDPFFSSTHVGHLGHFLQSKPSLDFCSYTGRGFSHRKSHYTRFFRGEVAISLFTFSHHSTWIHLILSTRFLEEAVGFLDFFDGTVGFGRLFDPRILMFNTAMQAVLCFENDSCVLSPRKLPW